MRTDRDIEMATAFLLASGKTHTKADLDALAELLAHARAAGIAAVVSAAHEHLDAGSVTRVDYVANIALGGIVVDPRPPPHAGECALCRAPFVRTAEGARPSCGCHGAKPGRRVV